METQLQQLQRQFKATTSKITELELATKKQQKTVQKTWKDRRARINQAAQEVSHIRTAYLDIRKFTTNQIQEFSKRIEEHKNTINSFKTPKGTKMDQAMALVKIEAFDHWIDGKSTTKVQMTAKLLLERITAKMGHTFRNLKLALNQVTNE